MLKRTLVCFSASSFVHKGNSQSAVLTDPVTFNQSQTNVSKDFVNEKLTGKGKRGKEKDTTDREPEAGYKGHVAGTSNQATGTSNQAAGANNQATATGNQAAEINNQAVGANKLKSIFTCLFKRGTGDSVEAKEKASDPFAFGDFSWLNGARCKTSPPAFDSNYFTGDVTFDFNYTHSYNSPIDNTVHGINLDAGIFMSYIGLFSYNNFENRGYQPSYTSDNTPWFFNGLRLQTFPTDKLKVELWLDARYGQIGKPDRTGTPGEVPSKKQNICIR